MFQRIFIPQTSKNATHGRQGRSSSLRQLVEALVTLAVAVILFRTFQVEGYLISTGSMAPTLLGYHKRVVCPSCRSSFPLGLNIADSGHNTSTAAQHPQSAADSVFPVATTWAVCPNCGQDSIDAGDILLSDGDQLLVQKFVYEFRQPRRWEGVVFRNPAEPTQSVVKRIAGLPGEAVQIVDGDVTINGTVARKDLRTQRALRIPVYDDRHEPEDDPNWESRWVPVPFKSQRKGWKKNGAVYAIDDRPGPTREPTKTIEESHPNARVVPPLAPNELGEFHWLAYRHWIRSGGTHTTSVPLAERLMPDWDSSATWDTSIRYNSAAEMLSCRGVLSRDRRDQFLSRSDEPEFVNAIRQLYRESHIASILDQYGYNGIRELEPSSLVHDLMVSAVVTMRSTRGTLLLQMEDGRHTFSCIFDPTRNEVRLHVDEQNQPVLTRPLPMKMRSGPVLVEMSLFDQQVLVAVDGELVFDPWLYSSASNRKRRPLRRPIRWGARGLAVEVTSLKLFRDIHYRSGLARNGVLQPFSLKSDEFFVLGDNSPVSLDSRSWEQATVTRRMMSGKPFLVHLPSRPARFQFGDRVAHIRIPDVSRIRYIR